MGELFRGSLGIDTLEAFNIRQELIQANKDFEKIDAELTAIYRMFGSNESLISESSLNSEIKEIQKNIINLELAKESTRTATIDDISEKVLLRIKELTEIVDKKSDEIVALESTRRELQIELKETAMFLRSIEERKVALSESQLAYSTLGEISFKYCPSCLEPIKVYNECFCNLCKTPNKNGENGYGYSQLLNELNFQINESKKLIESFEADINKINSNLPKIRQQLIFAKTELKEINTSSDEKEAKLLGLASEIGFSNSQIVFLEEKREQAQKVDLLKQKKLEANQRLSNLHSQLDEITARQESRYLSVYNSIESKAIELLKLDGGYEKAFKDPEEVTFDFAKDKMFVNGRSKFSASSMVVMKNSIRFSIFAHAADDQFSRLPNLLLMDNMEDKGMQPERSQNFQEQIVNVSKNIKNNFQLIYTTSMIADDLEGSELCVGPFYKKGTHTLEF